MEARVNKYNLNELLNDAVANLLIGMLAAIVRLAFAREDSFRVALVTFGGGVALAVLVGWLIRDIPWLHAYSNGVVALSALVGKEVVNALRQKLPNMLVRMLQVWVNGPESKGRKDDV